MPNNLLHKQLLFSISCSIALLIPSVGSADYLCAKSSFSKLCGTYKVGSGITVPQWGIEWSTVPCSKLDAMEVDLADDNVSMTPILGTSGYCRAR